MYTELIKEERNRRLIPLWSAIVRSEQRTRCLQQREELGEKCRNLKERVATEERRFYGAEVPRCDSQSKQVPSHWSGGRHYIQSDLRLPRIEEKDVCSAGSTKSGFPGAPTPEKRFHRFNLSPIPVLTDEYVL